MKERLMKRLRHIGEELTYGIRRLCLRPSPGVRLSIIVLLVVASGAANIWFVASSIYNMGVSDTKRQFLEVQHIETLKLQSVKDSINIINQKKYEYEQESDK